MEKVFLVTNSFAVGGLATVIMDQAKSLNSMGLKPCIIALHSAGNLNPGCRVISLSMKDSTASILFRLLYAICRPFIRNMGNVFLIKKNKEGLRACLEEAGYSSGDVVILHGFKTIIKVGGMPSVSAISVLHEMPGKMISGGNYAVRLVQRAIANSFFKRSRMVAVSDAVKKDFHNIFGEKKRAIKVIHNGIDIDALRVRASEPSNVIDGRYIVSVGRLEKVKGFDVLIRAFSAIRDADLKLVIVGGGSESVFLGDLAHSLGVQERVLFLGHLENPLPIVARAELFVSASWSEGFGLAVLEAACIGTPVICTGVGGLAELLEGDACCFFKPGSCEDLREKMECSLYVKPASPGLKGVLDIQTSMRRYLELG